jgi:hypothetical protein
MSPGQHGRRPKYECEISYVVENDKVAGDKRLEEQGKEASMQG